MTSQNTRVFFYNVKSQPLSYYLAVLLLTIGYVLCIVSLILDQLTQITVDLALGGQNTNYCGWQQVHNKEEVINEQNNGEYTYKDLCDDGNEFCDMKTGGDIWLGAAIVALVVGCIAWIGLWRNVYDKSKLCIMFGSFLFSVCCFIAIISWVVLEHCKEWCSNYPSFFLHM